MKLHFFHMALNRHDELKICSTTNDVLMTCKPFVWKGFFYIHIPLQ